MILSRIIKFIEFKIKRLHALVASKTPNHKLIIDNSEVKQIKLMGGFNIPGISKAGRFSCQGSIQGKKIKVYECFSNHQVKIRLAVSDFQSNNVCFPKVLAYNDRYVVEQWINGVNLSRLRKSEIEAAQNRVFGFLKDLHEHTLTGLSDNKTNNVFCYLTDFLLDRVQPWRCYAVINVFILKWHDAYLKISNEIPKKIHHPDLHVHNIVCDKKNDLFYVIDNELLSYGKGWILDYHNTRFKSTPLPYSKEKDFGLFAQLSWALRLIGSDLSSGNVHRALKLANCANKEFL